MAGDITADTALDTTADMVAMADMADIGDIAAIGDIGDMADIGDPGLIQQQSWTTAKWSDGVTGPHRAIVGAVGCKNAIRSTKSPPHIPIRTHMRKAGVVRQARPRPFPPVSPGDTSGLH